MAGFKADQNIRIGRAGRSGIAVRKIDSTIRQSDVVDNCAHFLGRNLLANGVVHQIAKPGGLFDTSTGPAMQVQLELARIHAGEEVPAEPGDQQQTGTEAGDEKCPQKCPAVLESALQQSVIRVTEAFEGVLKANLQLNQRVTALLVKLFSLMLVAAQQIFGHGGNQCP